MCASGRLIARTVTGKMVFRTLSDGCIRGGEDFRLLVHPDGTRQIFIRKDFKAYHAQQTSSVYILNAAPRGDVQVSGFLTESKFTRLGTEKVTTPAGTFDAVHYRLAGVESLEMWIAGEDRLLVRQTDTKNDREYVLTEIRQEGKDLFSDRRK
jgi:hypothetical protein